MRLPPHCFPGPRSPRYRHASSSPAPESAAPGDSPEVPTLSPGEIQPHPKEKAQGSGEKGMPLTPPHRRGE